MRDTQQYLGLTDLEVKLFEGIELLVKRVNRLNGYLEKANGYGDGNISYKEYLKGIDELNNRLVFETSILEESEFNKLFEIKRRHDDPAYPIQLYEIDIYTHDIKPEEIALIKSSFGKSFLCKVRPSNSSGHCDIVTLDNGYEFPVKMFKGFNPIIEPSVSANTIDGFLGFENHKLPNN